RSWIPDHRVDGNLKRTSRSPQTPDRRRELAAALGRLAPWPASISCGRTSCSVAPKTSSFEAAPGTTRGHQERTTMEIIGAAALIAVGIVLAAVLYGRMHGARLEAARGARAAEAELELPERTAALARREDALARREAQHEQERQALAQTRHELQRALEQASGLPAARAKQMLMKEIEEDAKHDAARRLRQIEEETKREAERRVRNILSVCMQRLAAGHASENTVSVVHLSADDMKGRIIGREGRNIRALENLTGVDFIIDDTPGAVVLSGFDGVRREIARLTLEKLLQDGRIHPARIEEMYYHAKSELEQHIIELGEQAVFEAGVQGLSPDLIKLLGRLKFR